VTLKSPAESLAPDEKQADITWHTAGEIQHACRQMEAARLQFLFPAQVEFSRFAAQGGWPTGLIGLDRATAIVAKLRWEALQHQLLEAVFGGLSRVVQHCSPRFVADVVVDQLFDLLTATLGGGAALRLPVLSFAVLEIGDGGAKIDGRHPGSGSRHGKLRLPIGGGLIPAVEVALDPVKNPGLAGG
jgi:hypothetical protein